MAIAAGAPYVSPDHVLPWILLYVGPDALLPLASAFAAITGVVLMFWRGLIALAGRLRRLVLPRRTQSRTTQENISATEPRVP